MERECTAQRHRQGLEGGIVLIPLVTQSRVSIE